METKRATRFYRAVTCTAVPTMARYQTTVPTVARYNLVTNVHKAGVGLRTLTLACYFYHFFIISVISNLVERKNN